MEEGAAWTRALCRSVGWKRTRTILLRTPGTDGRFSWLTLTSNYSETVNVIKSGAVWRQLLAPSSRYSVLIP
jgi:hypothetical protein